jgi:dTDP-4-amino-4,6-dideoxygalactose transaminase
MNIDPAAIAAAVTGATRVVVALHYAGIACDMEAIGAIAAAHGLTIVEDAAHAVLAAHGERALGTIGTFGCLSFHESKNLHCGEGGALIVNDPVHVARAEILLEKGTDRRRFFRGETDRYSWQDLGSSYVLSELNCAFLLAQLEGADAVTAQRRASWAIYHDGLEPLAEAGRIDLPHIPAWSRHNGHIFWIKTRSAGERGGLQAFLAERGVHTHSHYVPLHSAPAGRRFGRFVGEDRHTSDGADRLLRLPIHYGFERAADVVDAVTTYFGRAW